MIPEREFAQFRQECPECESHLDPVLNEFGLPLTPSATHRFFEWKGQTGRMPQAETVAVCQSLVERFGDGVRHGRVASWDQPKRDKQSADS